MDQLEIDDGLAAAQPLHLLQTLGRGGKHVGEAAEGRQQLLGERLGVAARNGAGKEKLEQLVIGQRIGAGLHEARPQPLAMAEIMRLALGCRRARAIPHGPPA